MQENLQFKFSLSYRVSGSLSQSKLQHRPAGLLLLRRPRNAHRSNTERCSSLDWAVPRQLTPRKWHRREVLSSVHHSRGTWQSSSLVGDGNFEHPVNARFVEPEAVTELDPTPQQLPADSEKSSEGWPDSCPDAQRLTHMCGPGRCASTRQCGKCLQVWIAIT